MLIRTGQVAVAIGSIRAYPNGLELTAHVRMQGEDENEPGWHEPFDRHGWRGRDPGGAGRDGDPRGRRAGGDLVAGGAADRPRRRCLGQGCLRVERSKERPSKRLISRMPLAASVKWTVAMPSSSATGRFAAVSSAKTHSRGETPSSSVAIR